MRDLAKSAVSWAWAVSVFSGLQVARLIAVSHQGTEKVATGAFDTVSEAAGNLLTAPLESAWKMGLDAQNMVFGALGKVVPATIQSSAPGTAPASDPAGAGEPMPIGSLSASRK